MRINEVDFENRDKSKNSKLGEGISWRGTSDGTSEHDITDHSFEEAQQYFRNIYPYHKTYSVRRVEPGFRAGVLMPGHALMHPTKANATKQEIQANFAKEYNLSNVQSTNVDQAVDYLNLERNNVMSGSYQYSVSLGYSWHVMENREIGAGILYYQDRGMGNDTITIGTNDRAHLTAVIDVFRNAGVIPDKGEMALRRAEKANIRLGILNKKGIKPGRKFGYTDSQGEHLWQVTAITKSGKVKAKDLSSGIEQIWSPSSITKQMLLTGLTIDDD